MLLKELSLRADPQLVETWVKGWSLARETSPPVNYKDGFRVDVGWPNQLVRYVFPAVSKDYLRLTQTITTPWHFLKVCALPSAVIPHIANHWQLQPPGFMMTAIEMTPMKVALPQGYTLQQVEQQPVSVVKVLSQEGEVAAIGRIVVVDDYVIYDRIVTSPDHRRKGLASIIMNALYKLGLERGVKKGVLVATAEGKLLYESLGWRLHTPYTTIVIPGDK